MYRSPHSCISLTKLIPCLQGWEALGVQSTGCTFGPLVTLLSFLSQDCLWTYRHVLGLGVQARPRSGQMWMSQEAILNHGGLWAGKWLFLPCVLGRDKCILHSCSVSSGSHPTFQKVSFRPSLTLPTSSSCVPGTISKISSLYSVQSPLMAGILDALASGSLLTKERQPSQGLSVLGRQEKPRLGVGLSYINQPIQSPYPGPSPPAGFYPPRSNVLVTRSCPTLCNPVDCSPQGSCVHGIPQVRTLEWAAISFSSQEAILFSFNHSRPSTRHLEIVFILQSPLQLFQTANHKRGSPALSCLSHRNHSEGSCPCLPLAPASWPSLVLLYVALHGRVHSPCLTNVNRLPFQWQWSPDLLNLSI